MIKKETVFGEHPVKPKKYFLVRKKGRRRVSKIGGQEKTKNENAGTGKKQDPKKRKTASQDFLKNAVFRKLSKLNN